jgi:hypothetical protein
MENVKNKAMQQRNKESQNLKYFCVITSALDPDPKDPGKFLGHLDLNPDPLVRVGQIRIRILPSS